MKILKYSLAFIAGLSLLVSCNNWLDPDINIDPNKPDDAPVELMLAGVEAGMGYVYGGDIGRFNSLFTQHMAGTGRQHIVIDQYSLTESDVDNAWRFNLYAGVLADLDAMIAKADDGGSPHYAGVARVLMANALGVTTDLWGDIPFDEAFQGLDNLQPGYNTQEAIYGKIFDMLDRAITDLSAAESVISPDGVSDPMYAGDLDAWKGAAYALMARYHLHLSKVDGNAYADALTALGAGGIADNSGDLEYTFSSTVTGNNPWYQFNDQRGDITMGKTFVDMMNDLSDPRLTVFCDDTITGGVYAGSPSGDPGPEASLMGAYYGSTDSPVPFVSYVEQKFIEAEAKFNTGDMAGAADAHNAAVIASLAKFGVSDATYEADNASETAGSISMETIIKQKYIALFTQVETWTDWRRTGLPALTPAANNVTGNVMPRRWPYPQSERLFNGGSIPSAPSGLTDRLWWDPS